MGSNLGIEPSDLFRLVKITCDIATDRGCSVSDAIDQLDAAASKIAPAPKLLNFAHTAKRYRLKRNEAFGTSLFRDPAWDMLLDLLIADEEGKSLSVTALCLGSGVATTTALRYVQHLVDGGFVIRTGDLRDQRRIFLTLDPARKAEIAGFLGNWLKDCTSGRSSAKADRVRPVPEHRERPATPSARHPLFLS